MGNRIYLDYNSTTPVDRRVVEAMMPAFSENFGNPSSESHDTGRVARVMVDEARAGVAAIVKRDPQDVIFTSGATEANNLAIHGIAAGLGRPMRAAVISTEHKSVLEPYRALEREAGADVRYVPVSGDGLPETDWLEEIPDGSLDMVSVAAANGETGVINPVGEIAGAAHRKGALVHCDATQIIGKSEFNAGLLETDMITFSSHKIYGPKGCGALVAARDVRRRRLRGVVHGGGQEDGLRSGTLNVPAIVGFGAACKIAAPESPGEAGRQGRLRDTFEDLMISKIPGAEINGRGATRLPNTSNIRIPGAFADAVIANAPDVEISTGSACTSSTMEPSHVLVAMGLNHDAANECIRVSIGRQTTGDDITSAASAIDRAAAFVIGKGI